MQRPIAFGATLLAASAGMAQVPTITDIGVLPTGATSTALGVSADGLAVVGECLIQPGGRRAVRWMTATGMTNLGTFPGGNASFATGTSGDGRVVIGQANGTGLPTAFRWTAPGPMVTVGALGGSTARGVSADGSTIVGDSASTAFVWTAATGVHSLPFLPGTTTSTAMAVSADGSVVVGGSAAVGVGGACRWVDTADPESLGTLPGGANAAIAYAANDDGNVIVGLSTGPGQFAYRWTAGGGASALGTLPGMTSSVAWGVSGDGSVVVGAYGSPSSHAFLWTEATGIVDLQAFLVSRGLDMTGWNLTAATGVSADGTIIVGSGTVDLFSRGWVVNLDADTDDDGLRDSWEILGVPYKDAQGVTQRIELPDADPLHKNLYVELDSMSGFTFSPSAVSDLQQAFADAPVSNPDGTTGITLRILLDDTTLPHIAVWLTSNGCWPADFNTVRSSFFGTASERSGPNAVMLLQAKAKAYRYCVLADAAGPDRIQGCAPTPGDNVVLFGSRLTTANAQAGVFMHEFGHNLGLLHGGGDSINAKPNYPSVMNYMLTRDYGWAHAFWRLDYSRLSPPANLNESSLNEQIGIGSPSGFYSSFFMPYGVNVTQGGGTQRAIRFVRLNGSPTDFGTPSGSGFQDGFFDTGVPQDLNYLVQAPLGVRLPSVPSPGQTLIPYDDWAHIKLPLQSTQGAGAPAAIFPIDELTEEAVDWITQNVAPPGTAPSCYANCDGSTNSPILNVLDFSCFLNRFAAGDSYANCDASTAPPVLNVLDFSCFLNQFAAGCS